MMKRHLLTPGPTPVPPEALLAMARLILYHRGPEFEETLAAVREGLKVLCQTQNEVLLFAASGTGAMEAAVVNTLSPGDPVLVIQGGKFGERWGELGAAYGLRVEAIEVSWGQAVDPAVVAERLRAHPEIRAVFATHSETSTGVLHDVRALAEIVRPTPALLIVDAITSLGVTDLPMDAWGIDVVVAGSQKALMLPPGLAFCGVSDKAWEASRRSTLPKFYFNFAAERKALEKNQNAFTPAVSLIVGLKATLDLIRAEGLPQVFARHDRLARATRAGVQALGLELFAAKPSPAVTAVKTPRGTASSQIVRTLRTKYGVTIAGGQGPLKDKIFRLSHMGFVDDHDIVVGLAALERGLADLGYPAKLGEATRAAQEIFQHHAGIPGTPGLCQP